MKTEEPAKLFAHTRNYRKDGDRDGLINRGFWIHNLPRLSPVCRLWGHKPVVDGTEGTRNRAGYRWVCCDRCGLRPRPQGDLDAGLWSVGDRFDETLPGPWPKARGVLGGQFVFGRRPSRWMWGLSLTVGCAGDDHTLSCWIGFGPLGALYLHTEAFGTGLQRRLNPTGYASKVIEVGADNSRLWWRLWMDQMTHRMSTPRWRDGSVAVGVRDRLLGEVRFTYEKIGGRVPAVVRMPEGDDHAVTLQLERQRRGRKRGRARCTWRVDWSTEGAGIPDGPRGSISAASVEVSDSAVEKGQWRMQAVVRIAEYMTAERIRHAGRAEKETA